MYGRRGSRGIVWCFTQSVWKLQTVHHPSPKHPTVTYPHHGRGKIILLLASFTHRGRPKRNPQTETSFIHQVENAAREKQSEAVNNALRVVTDKVERVEQSVGFDGDQGPVTLAARQQVSDAAQLAADEAVRLSSG